jgi:hypothetical protein
MIFSNLSIIPMIAVAVTSVFLMVSQNWRWSIIAVAVQYLAVFWLVALVWPFSLSVVKLIAGWMAGAVLSATRPDEDLLEEHGPAVMRSLFRVIAAGLVLALVVSILPLAASRLPVSPRVLESGLILIAIGLLHLGMTTRPLRVILGLLTVLSGFELVYATLETSIVIAGLQAVITLGLALSGAYLIAAPGMEKDA